MTEPAATATAVDLPQPDCERWQLLRAGLENIWEYDSQRFAFHRGHLMLRGRNESGKSKVLEVLLPFLLDGSLAPSRLDPFGSTSRQMRWNLINEDTPQQVQVSVGFVWLEFGRRIDGEDEFCTLGARLRAKRSDAAVEVDFFITGLRPDLDLDTLDTGRRPLSRKALEAALGDRGRLLRRGVEYRREVNKILFGLPAEQYDALVETLLQLRRPQLSKQLQPSELSAILSASLPPLDPGVIGRLAEGFQRLDRDRGERDELAGTGRAATAFLDVYARYVAGLARLRAAAMTAADSAFQKRRGEQRRAAQALAEARARMDDCRTELAATADRLAELEARREALQASDAYRSVQQLDEAEREVDRCASRADEAANRAQADKENRERKREQLRRAGAELDAGARGFESAARAARQAARPAAMADEGEGVLELAGAGRAEDAGAALETLLRARREALEQLDALGGRVTEARAVVERAAERLQDRAEDLRSAQADAEALQRQREAAVAALRQDALDWLAADPITAGDGLARKVATVSDPTAIDAALMEAGRRRRAELDEERTEVGLVRRRAEERVRTLEQERELLAAMDHVAPQPPPWRSEREPRRPGAPFYLLCEFDPDLDKQQRAGIEAALEAAGILDAWVGPAGEVMASGTREVLLRAGPPAAGGGLGQVLRPVPRAGVDAETIRALLAGIGLDDDLDPAGAAAAPGCSIATAGRFRSGPLAGSNRKQRAELIGAGERAAARRRRLAELAGRIAVAEGEVDAAGERRAAAERAWAAVEAAIEERPGGQAVDRLEVRLADVLERVELARSEHDRLLQDHLAAGERLAGERSRRDAAAVELGLAAWKERPAELGRLGERFRELATAAVQRALQLAEQRTRFAELERDRDDLEARHASTAREAEQARQELVRARAIVATLREQIGATREQLLAELAAVREERSRLADGLEQLRAHQGELNRTLGGAEGLLATAGEAVTAAEAEREAAAAAVRRFAGRGLLAVAGLEAGGSRPERWSLTDTLAHSRRIMEATGHLEHGPEAAEKRENEVAQALQQCQRELPPDIRLAARRAGGLLEVEASWNARPLAIAELVGQIESELAERERLLAAGEMELFESFLSGETHEHLQSRLRSAHELVERMNAQLARRPTASGMVLRIRWKATPEAPAGTEQAIGLMLRAGELLTRDNRDTLIAFLRDRLDEARHVEQRGSLAERMAGVLDYRGWFRFTIEFKKDGGGWRPLTRKAHGAGSGGQKAVMLHMPLFAATAAFYESAGPRAARLIALDEAFAGIDREMRAQLMGLLVHFDLDFIMTSHEEWGFYGELDGLSTYHLAREPGLRGVYADHFLWDGASVHELGAA